MSIKDIQIADKVYGKVKIEEPVLIELLNSKPMLRLKGISQYGIPDKYYKFKNYSRYEHSVGVMILLKLLGAPLKEQVAGLLHDVSHLAFSHVADWVFSDGPNGDENFHHTLQEKFVRETKVAEILERFDFSVDEIIDESNFPLLEKEIPDICADRIDYAIREVNSWLEPANDVSRYVKDLIIVDNEIVFADYKSAAGFAEKFLELQSKHWGGRDAVTRYHIFSETLKSALENNVLSKEDFYKEDDFVLNKLENTENKGILSKLVFLKNKNMPTKRGGQSKKVFKKFRYIDPKIKKGNNLVRLSETDSGFKKKLEKYREENKKGILVPTLF